MQIGNAIAEKKMLDVLLPARDRGLYSAITDCGAGGFSVAVGEMGEEIGAEVWLDRAPLKYEGLSLHAKYGSPKRRNAWSWPCRPRIGQRSRSCARPRTSRPRSSARFEPTGRLKLLLPRAAGRRPGDGVPARWPPAGGARGGVRAAGRRSHSRCPSEPGTITTSDLLEILRSWNVCSKEWIIRQYDHEVQGGASLKPLVGGANDGPAMPPWCGRCSVAGRGIGVSCGINPHYGDFDTVSHGGQRHRRGGAQVRRRRRPIRAGSRSSTISAGATPSGPRCSARWSGRPMACHDVAIACGTPFISGKDSLNNEFRHATADGGTQSIAMPSSLLISALGQIDDVSHAVTMDLKEAGNVLYQVGLTKDELGGSHFVLRHRRQRRACAACRRRSGARDLYGRASRDQHRAGSRLPRF